MDASVRTGNASPCFISIPLNRRCLYPWRLTRFFFPQISFNNRHACSILDLSTFFDYHYSPKRYLRFCWCMVNNSSLMYIFLLTSTIFTSEISYFVLCFLILFLAGLWLFGVSHWFCAFLGKLTNVEVNWKFSPLGILKDCSKQRNGGHGPDL